MYVALYKYDANVTQKKLKIPESIMPSRDIKKGNIVMQTNQAMPVCLLCRKNPQREISHIFPKFIMKKLKAEGDNGRLRNPANPNCPLQDGPKRLMLCQECEDLLSKFEVHFANKIFHPSYKGKLPEDIGTSDTISLKFLASLSFRLIAWSLEGADFPNCLIPAFKFKLNVLRDYLLDEISNTLPTFHELFYVADYNNEKTKDENRLFYYYIKSAIDADYIICNNEILQYAVKFGPFISLMTLGATFGRSVTCDSALPDGFVTKSLPLANLPHQIKNFLIGGYELASKGMNMISPKQQKEIEDRWRRLNEQE